MVHIVDKSLLTRNMQGGNDMKRLFFLILAACLLSSCASSRRMERLSIFNAFERDKSMNDSTVNLWPIFLSGQGYFSALWPMIDFDQHGFAVRPLINKEKKDWSILFPVLAWNTADKDGWCALGYWNTQKRYCGLFPLFHYDADYDKIPGGKFYSFPLVWIGRDKFYSIPYCYKKKTYYDSSFRRLLTEYQENHGENAVQKQYLLFLLMYLKQAETDVLDKQSPAFRQDYYYADYNKDKTVAKNLQLRDTGKQQDDALKYVRQKLAPAVHRETFYQYGFFPLFDIKTSKPSGNCEWDLLLHILASGRTTPGNRYFCAPPLLTYWQEKYSKGDLPPDEKTERKFFMPFYYSTQETGYRRKWETAYRFGTLSPEHFERRLYLTVPEDIKHWEVIYKENVNKEPEKYWWYGYTHFNIFSRRPQIPGVPDGSELKKAGEEKGWQKYPMPKTAAEAEKGLAELSDLKNYDKYEISGSGVYPFFMQTDTRCGEHWRNSTDAALWLYRSKADSDGLSKLSLGYGLLGYFENRKDSHNWTIPLFWQDKSATRSYGKNSYTLTDWEKRYLLWYYGADEYYVNEGKSKGCYRYHGLFPLWHYGSGDDKNLFALPFLLSWRSETAHLEKDTDTKILLGLLYSGKKRVREKNNPFTAEEPTNLSVMKSTERHLALDESSTKYSAVSYDFNTVALMADKKDAELVFWKKDTPQNIIQLDGDLAGCLYTPTADELRQVKKRLADLNIKTDNPIDTRAGNTQAFWQLVKRYGEIRNYSKRSFLGRPGFCYVSCGEDSAFWLGGGLLARNMTVDKKSETSVLWYLYRSTVTPDSSTRLIFPFIKTHSSKAKSSFSFLWRFLNIEKTKEGIGGHIFFIPF